MNRKEIIIAFVSISIGLMIGFSYPLFSQKTQQVKGVSIMDAEQSFCTISYDQLHLEQTLYRNNRAISFIKNNCLKLNNVLTGDLKNNGSSTLILVTSQNCVGCTLETIHVLLDDAIIFEQTARVPLVTVEKIGNPTQNVLIIVEPELSLKTTYVWNENKNEFSVYDKQTVKIP